MQAEDVVTKMSQDSNSICTACPCIPGCPMRVVPASLSAFSPKIIVSGKRFFISLSKSSLAFFKRIRLLEFFFDPVILTEIWPPYNNLNRKIILFFSLNLNLLLAPRVTD